MGDAAMWAELYVNLSGVDVERRRSVLLEVAGRLRAERGKSITSWHLLWDNKPWPVTLRLRFRGDEGPLNALAAEISERFKKDGYDVCVGGREGCGRAYTGGEDLYGKDGSELIAKVLEMGSEIAVEFVSARGALASGGYTCDGCGKDTACISRCLIGTMLRLLMSQLSTEINAAPFLLGQAVILCEEMGCMELVYRCGVGPTFTRCLEMLGEIKGSS
jgi:hypothetical protein